MPDYPPPFRVLSQFVRFRDDTPYFDSLFARNDRFGQQTANQIGKRQIRMIPSLFNKINQLIKHEDAATLNDIAGIGNILHFTKLALELPTVCIYMERKFG
ncbi:hypothetical protein CKO35_15685 [Ectothiorhodospira shaposhnikovii]|nr:hypothetical protein [Ectothiorhodospira shaposhnikovii]